jgi:hypothetical protein
MVVQKMGSPGIQFLTAVVTASRRAELPLFAASVVVFQLAELALSGGYVSEAHLRSAARLVRRETHLSTHRLLESFLEALSFDARLVMGWRERLGVQLMALGVELLARGAFGPATDVFALVSRRVPSLRREAKRQLARARAKLEPRRRKRRAQPARTKPLYYDSDGVLHDLREYRVQDFVKLVSRLRPFHNPSDTGTMQRGYDIDMVAYRAKR